ncbi:MAG: putative metal-binding motif-containing protein, partial [Lentisphaeria bacterium]|nr:putative metal-binding motif-containing protein [Lentisphaeria bacterium]
DDADENNWTSCDTCVDGDGDGHYAGCDAYTSIDGPDCDDFDENNWISCSDCVDSDGDSAYVDCDAYISIEGPDCDDNDDASYPGGIEVCDGNDNDCSSGVDANETDDDGDGYVECAGWNDTQGDDTAVTAGGDCDDSTDLAFPGNDPEICGDGIDNNCDGMTDLEDSATCPTISVSIWNTGDPQQVSHGSTISVGANISPPDPNGTAPWAWSRDWQVIDAQPTPQCNISDLIKASFGDWDDYTYQQFTMPDDVNKLGCIYTVEITVNGYATDSHRLEVVNHAPVITDVLGATFDGSVWHMNVPVGVQLTMQVRATDTENDNPLHFDWNGADVGQLQCTAGSGCDSSDATSPYESLEDWVFPTIYRASPYQLTVSVYDDFDSSDVTTADIEVTVENCVWVEAGGGDGVGTLAAPRTTIAGALLQAASAPDTNVCIIGADTFTEDITLPASPNAPDLLGGFDSSGILSTDRPIIEVADTAGLQFETGGTNRLYHLRIEQGTDDGASVSIVDASPSLDDCIIMIPGGSLPKGVQVRANDGLTAQPVINGCAIRRNWGDPSIASATGLAVVRAGTGLALPTLLDSSVEVVNCTGLCRGIQINPGTSANILDNGNIRAQSVDGHAIGIEVTGSFGQTTSAHIEGNNQISADSDGTRSIAVNLFLTQDVVIQNNRWLGTPWMSAGSEFSVGIADGVVLRDGSTSPGLSDGLIIRGNEMISGGSSWLSTDCSGLGDTGEGVDVNAGILLVGSRNANIADNGRPNDEFAGIFGGSSTVHWVPERRRLPPSAVGLWLVDTHDVTVTDNEIRAGSYNMFEGCPDPSRPDFSPEIPVATAYRDGLPPNDEYLFGPAPGELPSHGTVFARNGASCALPPENGAMGGAIVTWCAAAELNVPESNSAPFLVNNHLAATKGNMLIALWQNGGSGVVAINNTFDSDLMLKPWDPPPFPDSIRKWAVLAENLAPDGLTLINNIFNVHRDDPYDRVSERLGLYERVISSSGSAESNIQVLDNNLFYIEGDDLGDPTSPIYARIDSGLGVAEYAAVDINAIVGISSILGNFVDLPGLGTVTNDWAKSTVRLQAGSAAIDSGSTAAGVPVDDIDRQRRPDPSGGVDIGHDEYYP